MVLRILFFVLIILISLQAQIESPDVYLNTKIGEDRNLIDWKQISDYFKYISEKSPRIELQKLGHSTLGKPFYLVIISSRQNIADLEKFRSMQKQIAWPELLDENNKEKLIVEARAVVLITLNIHSTEIASSQESVELAYELATSQDERIQNILNNVIILLVPSLNPDGQQMVVDWYREYKGTPYEGSRLPKLYHPYAGHDNNRDWHYFNLQESRLVADVLYKQWFPEVVFDQHQMGSSGPRLFVPPYSDPVNPNIPAVLTSEVNLIGSKIVSDLHDMDLSGIVTGTIFNAYFQGTMSKTPLWHNMVGILSEAASCRIATPVYFPYGSLNSFGPDLPEYKVQTNFLNPWRGGWWGIRNIIEYEKAATYSLLDVVANYRKKFIANFYNLNSKNIVNGSTEKPYGFFIPKEQNDHSVLALMLKKLNNAGVRIDRVEKEFTFGEKIITSGSYYISCAQPVRNYIIDLFKKQNYPHLILYPNGPPLQPYDVTTWNMPLQMGIQVIENTHERDIDVKRLNNFVIISGSTNGNGKYIYFSPNSNWSAPLALTFLQQGKKVWRFTEKTDSFQLGSFVIENENKNNVQLINSKGIDCILSDKLQVNKITPLRLPEIGIYQAYSASMDEGWTRLVMDDYNIPYKSLNNSDIITGAGIKNIDVLILPSMSTSNIVMGLQNRKSRDKKIGDVIIPPKYRGGLGKKGIAEILQFVQNGGKLLAIDRSINFAADSLHLPVKILNKSIERKQFYIPGALLSLNLQDGYIINSGMGERSNVFFTDSSPIMKLLPYNYEILTPAIYPEHDILASGWALGESRLGNKVAIADIPVGRGNVILFGFSPLHRAQTFANFKFIFNSFF